MNSKANQKKLGLVFSQKFRTFFVQSLLGFCVASSISFAEFPPGIILNGDEYDVPKYEALFNQVSNLYRQAVGEQNAKQAQLNSLENSLNGARSKLAGLNQSLSEAQSELGSIDPKIASLRTQADSYRSQISQAQGQIQSLSNELASLRSQLSSIQSNLNQAKAQYQSAANAAASKESAANQQNQVVNSKRSLVQSLKQSQAKASSDLQQTQASLSQAATEITNWKAKLQGIDAEISRTQSAIDGIGARIRDSENRVRVLEGDAATLERKAAATTDPREAAKLRADAAGLRKQAADVKGQIGGLSRELSTSKTRLVSLQREKAGLPGLISGKESTLSDLNNRKGQLERQVQDLASQVSRAEGELSNEESKARTLAAEAASARSSAEQLKPRLSALEKQASDTQGSINSVSGRLQSQQGQLSQSQSQLNQVNNTLSQLEQSKPALQARINQLGQQINSENLHVVQLQNQVQSAQGELNQAAAHVQALASQYEQSQARLETVRSNFQRGLSIATQLGRDEGEREGAEEGNSRGRIAGQAAGVEIGAREGTRAGTQQGISLAEAAGTQAGTQTGSIEGTQQGTKVGNDQGRVNGQSEGNSQGLLAGFEEGRKQGDEQGFAEGTKQGHLQGGYEKGNQAGQLVGANRAELEALAKGEPIGYATTEKEIRAKPLVNLSHVNQSDAKRIDRGEVKSLSDAVIDRSVQYLKSVGFFNQPSHSKDRPSYQFPNGALQQQYERTYTDAFNSAASRAYDAAYADSYRAYYDVEYRRYFNDYANREYPDYRNRAYAAARERAYASSYQSSYEQAYQQAYAPEYTKAYQVAYPTRVQEGLEKGYQVGLARGKAEAFQADYDSGYAVGDRAGYQATYAGAYDRAVAKGAARASQFFQTHAVLEVESVELQEANGDSIFAPNELVTTQIIVKNYGGVAAVNELLLRLKGQTSGLEMITPIDRINVIEPSARVVISGVAQVKLKEEASKESVQYDVVNSEGVNSTGTLKSGSLSLNARYPFAATLASSQGVIPEQVNSISISVANLSQKASVGDVQVSVSARDSRIKILNPVQNLSQIGAGQSKALEIQFELPLVTELMEKGIVFDVALADMGGLKIGSNTLIIPATVHYVYRPGAQGLSFSCDSESLVSFIQTSRAVGLSYDVYHFPVEGSLNRKVLENYQGKVLLISSVASSCMDDRTADAISDFVSREGRLVIWDGKFDAQTFLGESLRKVASSWEMLKNEIQSATYYQSNFFIDGAPKGVIALASVAGSADHKVDSVNEVKAKQLLAFSLVSRDFASVIAEYVHRALSAARPVYLDVYRDAIFQILSKELWDDQRVKGSNFLNPSADNRTKLFVDRAVDETQMGKALLIEFSPDLQKEVLGIGGFTARHRRAQMLDVLAPLKAAYEAGHSN